MTNTTKYYPIMTESYYETELKLIVAEKRAFRLAVKTKSEKDSLAWLRASRRLVEHENNFGSK